MAKNSNADQIIPLDDDTIFGTCSSSKSEFNFKRSTDGDVESFNLSEEEVVSFYVSSGTINNGNCVRMNFLY